jgi:hypothetical protein
VAAAQRAIDEARAAGQTTLSTMGQTAREILDQRLSQDLVCGQFCDAMENTIREKNI